MVAAEKKALSMADLTFTITEHEKNYLKKLNFRDDVKSLSYGIDTNYFYLNWKPPEGKTKILFLGNYNHFPNVEAIKFISEKLSTKFMKDDQVELIIVGRNAEKIKKYIKPNFRVYENVKDVREFYWNSTIFIAPIFYGGGLRTKILEAAACGVPIVMSTLANNGFNFNNNDDVLIADEEEEYIEIIGRIISRNNFDLQKLSNNANKKIKEQFSSEVVTTKLLKYII
jgi:glycosyltransferase involved in cell wall biosynthesis